MAEAQLQGTGFGKMWNEKEYETNSSEENSKECETKHSQARADKKSPCYSIYNTISQYTIVLRSCLCLLWYSSALLAELCSSYTPVVGSHYKQACSKQDGLANSSQHSLDLNVITCLPLLLFAHEDIRRIPPQMRKTTGIKLYT